MSFPLRHAAWKVGRDEESVENWLRTNRLDTHTWADKVQLQPDGTIIVKRIADEIPREVYVKENRQSTLVDALKAIEALKRM